MATTAEAAQRNRQVIEALGKGDYPLAMSASYEGLQLMRNVLRGGGVSSNGVNSDSGAEKSGQVLGTSNNADNKLLSAVALTQATWNDDGAVALFHSAFSFHIPNTTKTTSCVDQDIILTSVLLYNLALSHHVLAMEKAESRRHNLEKAMEMYNMASCLLSEADDEMWVSDDNDDEGHSNDNGVMLLAMAILNNMSHIHAHVQDFDQFWSCIHAMTELLTTSTFSEEFAVTEEMIFFFMNSNLIGQSRFVASPAA